MPLINIPSANNGIEIEVAVGLTEARKDSLRLLGKPVPPTIRVMALIDTGATITCIHPDIARQLGLPPIRFSRMSTSNSGNIPQRVNQYLVNITVIAIGGSRQFTNVAVNAPSFSVPCQQQNISSQQGTSTGQNIQVLIGRDLLKAFVLTYDGPNDICMLSY